MAIRTVAPNAYAPGDSPNLRGAPLVPDPPDDDRSTLIASTGWVERVANVIPEYAAQSSSFTLTQDMIGRVIPVIPGSPAVTVTIQISSAASGGYPADALVLFYRSGTGTVTVAAGSGVTLITEGAAGTAVATGRIGPFAIRGPAGEIILRRRGTTNTWVASGALL
jgi:hypothetical protein